MDRETIARTWFSRDPLLHADMTEALRRGLGVIASAAERGVLVSADEDSCGMLSCADLDTALTLLDGRRFPLLSIHQAELESPLCRELGMETWMRCRQAVYLGKEPPAATEEDIRPLTGEHLDFLQANYRHEDSEYLAWLLERRALFGAFREEKLVGFIGKHAEGSMGLLEKTGRWGEPGAFPDRPGSGAGQPALLPCVYGQSGLPGPAAKAGPDFGGRQRDLAEGEAKLTKSTGII